MEWPEDVPRAASVGDSDETLIAPPDGAGSEETLVAPPDDAGSEETLVAPPDGAGSEETVPPNAVGVEQARVLPAGAQASRSAPNDSSGLPASRAELSVGAEFAGFLVEAAIARGEMGLVYRVKRLRLDRIEALKVIAPKYADDPGFHARFQREAMNAAIADHPHVVKVYDADEREGRLYMAMQYVDGVDLRQKLAAEGALPPTTAAEIVRQVGSALDAAHANGLIHRDVKPGNILIRGEHGAEHAYLSDFGVSRRVTGSNDLTHPGSIVGTPYYAAPEQHLGKTVDHRCDVYSLGCVLFEMLTGLRPYEGVSATAVGIAHCEQPTPSARDLNPRLPSAVDRVLAKAMAKEPGERFQSAGELGAAAVAATADQDRAGEQTLPWESRRTTAGHPATATPDPPDAGSSPTTRVAMPIGTGQAAALVACVGLVLLVRFAHRYIDYGNGMESLWQATKHGGDNRSLLREVDFRNLIVPVALAFLLVIGSLMVYRRRLAAVATLMALLAVGQSLRFALNLGPKWGTHPHTLGLSFWLSLGAGVVIAAGAAATAAGVAQTSPLQPNGGFG